MRVAGAIEQLEERVLLSHGGLHPRLPEQAAARALLATQLSSALTTTSSQAPVYLTGVRVDPVLQDLALAAEADGEDGVVPQTVESSLLIKLDEFRNMPAYAGIDGSGFSVVILDTGIDLDHPFFGPDTDFDGIADRIVYVEDFTGTNVTVQDFNGHGSNVSSIVASQDPVYTGMAPGADIIHLQVLNQAGAGNFAYVEQALQWVATNAAAYNIVSVNMSLSDGGNHTAPLSLHGIGDELEALTELDIIVSSAAGNFYFQAGAAEIQGVAYPAADPNSLGIGAVWDAAYPSQEPFNWSTGAIDYTTGPDRLASFSQRHPTMTEVFAPGAVITGANSTGGTVTYAGTSQASPHVAGVAALAQQVAMQSLGRRLTMAEFSNLLATSGVIVNDGDDEDDNVDNTGLDFRRLDMLALADAITEMGLLHVVDSNPDSGGVVSTPPVVFVIDFSDPYLPSTVNASDLLVNGLPANSVQLTDADSLTFHYNTSPVTVQGLQTMSIAAGAIQDTALEPMSQFTANFRFDTLALSVTAVAPADGAIVSPPLTSLVIDLNEPYLASSVGVNDIALSVGTVTGFTLVDANTIEYLLSGVDSEGSVSFSIDAGALADVWGNANPQLFVSSFTLEIDTQAIGNPFDAELPVGSLVYSTLATGTIGAADDEDHFTFALDADQTVTVVVSPLSALRPQVELFGPLGGSLGVASAAAAGEDTVLQSVAASDNGTYTVTVRGLGGTVGQYDLEVLLNSAVEAEDHNGPTNNSIASAQNIEPSFITLAGDAQRASITGTTDGGLISIGPDQFGYLAYVTTPAWEDISLTGTAVLAGMSNGQIQLPAGSGAGKLNGFVFNFYGTTYDGTAGFNSIWVNTEGLVTFMSGVVAAGGYNTNLTFDPNQPAIAAFWDNLVITPSATAKVYWQVKGSGSNQRLIVQWNNVRFASAPLGDTITFQTILHEADGAIEINYLDLDSTSGQPGAGGASATVGIKGNSFQIPPADYQRLLVSYNSGPNAFVGTGQSIRIQTGTPQDSGVDLYAFQLEAGERVSLGVEGLEVGSVDLTLKNSSGSTLAEGIPALALESVINDFPAPSAGTYYVEASGDAGITYRLLVTRSGHLEVEANDGLGASAQDITTTGIALGAIGYGTVPDGAPGTPYTGPLDIFSTPLSLGFAADGSFIGDLIGASLNGVEFFKWGQEIATYTVGFNGATYSNTGEWGSGSTSFPVTLENITSGTRHGIRATGDVVAGVHIVREVVWNDGDNYALVTMSLTNNTAATITGAAFLENHDPDPAGGSSTYNDVMPGGRVVMASNSYGAMALGSLDVRAVVSAEGLFVGDPFAVINSPNDPEGFQGDLAINLAFNLGNILAGQSRSATLAAVFGADVMEVQDTFVAVALDTLRYSDDYYRVAVNAGDWLTIATATPGDGAFQFDNELDAALELYNSSGQLVASDADSGAGGVNALVVHQAAATGNYTVRLVRENDTRGEYVLRVFGHTGPGAPPLPPNLPPVADHGGPYFWYEGQSLILDATGSYDPNPGDTLTYSWDLNNNGVFDDWFGPTAEFSWELVAYELDGPQEMPLIAVRVDDGNGGVTTSPYTSLAVINTPPTADAGGPYTIDEGESLSLSGAGSDPSPLDPLTYSWDVNADGIFGDAVGQAPTLSWSQLVALGISQGHTIYNVRLRVDDGDGGATDSAATQFVLWQPGDVTGDGLVTFVDFLVLQANYGITSGAARLDGDVTGEGAVNFQDFMILQAHYGEGTGGATVGGDVFASNNEQDDAPSDEPLDDVPIYAAVDQAFADTDWEEVLAEVGEEAELFDLVDELLS